MYHIIIYIVYIYISSASRGWACVCLPSLVSHRWSYERRSLESQEIPWNALQFFLRNWFNYSVLSSYRILSYQKIVPGMQSSFGPSHHRQVCNAKSHAIAPVEVLTWSRLKVCSNKMRACIQTSTNLLLYMMCMYEYEYVCPSIYLSISLSLCLPACLLMKLRETTCAFACVCCIYLCYMREYCI